MLKQRFVFYLKQLLEQFYLHLEFFKSLTESYFVTSHPNEIFFLRHIKKDAI